MEFVRNAKKDTKFLGINAYKNKNSIRGAMFIKIIQVVIFVKMVIENNRDYAFFLQKIMLKLQPLPKLSSELVKPPAQILTM